ncbi:alkane 1-monooxygenase [Frigidibacter sp. MR17.24]|uniref:alkane 1-monooxygenase n=1 Tax=Frigidibacter sp. MR17.24 TaxID=3127345 RepID=UPI003012FFB3
MTDAPPAPRPAPVAAFAAATLAPAGLIALAALAGGGWVWAALGYMTALTYALDRLIAAFGEGGGADGEAEFPAADALSVALAVVHPAVLALAIAGTCGATGLPGPARAGLFVAAGLWFGQVSNSNAHELIHRTRRGLYRLGVAVYVTLLHGQHASGHRLVHHRFVATPEDPATARAGEGFWAFLPRAWWGEFRGGWRAETALRARAAGRGRGLHPYAVYLAGGAACLGLGLAAFGWGGVAAHLGFAAYAQAQLMLSDYVQHYGLQRARDDRGRWEPVGPAHSWDAPQAFSGLVMLHAPRHADHHLHPGRPYPALRITRGATPMLPRSLPLMATLALVPPAWRRVMDPRLARWQARQGDHGVVTPGAGREGCEGRPGSGRLSRDG